MILIIFPPAIEVVTKVKKIIAKSVKIFAWKLSFKQAWEIKIRGIDKGRAIIIPTNAILFSIETKAENPIKQVRPNDRIKNKVNRIKKLRFKILLK